MDVDVGTLAKELHAAMRHREPVATLSSRVDGLDRATAYAVQDAGIRLRLADGESVVGGKLGFTSKAMQRAMGVPSPNWGWLTDAMLVTDAVVRLDSLIHPKVEPEIGFLLARDLVPPVTAAEVLAATEAVLPCLEVVDSRFVGFRFGPLDNIADDSSAGAVVLGDPVAPADHDLALVGCVLEADGEVVETAAGAAALDHPAAAVAWMANHAPSPLRAGHLVISGGLTGPLTLVPGMVVSATIDRLGSVELRVA
jgi:2-oxo-3-hexenedioate decarboxylase